MVFWIGTDVSEELAASIIGVDYCVCCSVLEKISDFILMFGSNRRVIKTRFVPQRKRSFAVVT